MVHAKRGGVPLLSICLDVRLRQVVAAFDRCWSQPQKRYFVTVLLGLP
jgi:hypothetical protein